MIVTAPGRPPFKNDYTGNARRLKRSELEPGYMLSPHFAAADFASKDGADVFYVSDELLKGLEYLRVLIGNKPINEHSGYRSISHNASVPGAATGSAHTTGHALDFSVVGMSHKDVALAAHRAGFRGVGLYTWGVHVDTRGRRFTRWFGRGVTPFAWPDHGPAGYMDDSPTDVHDNGEIFSIATGMGPLVAKVVSAAPFALLMASIAGGFKLIKR